jgi:hypothetical protein
VGAIDIRVRSPRGILSGTSHTQEFSISSEQMFYTYRFFHLVIHYTLGGGFQKPLPSFAAEERHCCHQIGNFQRLLADFKTFARADTLVVYQGCQSRQSWHVCLGPGPPVNASLHRQTSINQFLPITTSCHFSGPGPKKIQLQFPPRSALPGGDSISPRLAWDETRERVKISKPWA